MICKQRIVNLDSSRIIQCYKPWAVPVTGIILSMMIVKYRSLLWWHATGHIILIINYHYFRPFSWHRDMSLLHKQHHTPSSLIYETSNTIILSSLFMKAMRSISKNIRFIEIVITATATTIIVNHHHWSTEARFAAGEFKSPWVPGITLATKLEGKVESWKTLKYVEIIRMVRLNCMDFSKNMEERAVKEFW